jgi:hypothetical protein
MSKVQLCVQCYDNFSSSYYSSSFSTPSCKRGGSCSSVAKELGGWLLLLLSSSRGGAHTILLFLPFPCRPAVRGGGGRACKNRILHQQSSPPSPSSTPLRVFRGIDVPQLLLYKFIHPPLYTFLPANFAGVIPSA